MPTIKSTPRKSVGGSHSATTNNDSQYIIPQNIQRNILLKLKRRDKQQLFYSPVNKQQLPYYYEIIKEPMDFDTLNNKINKNMYKYYNDYVYDVMLIFDNAMYFNEENSVYYNAAKELKLEANKILDDSKHTLTLEKSIVNNNNNIHIGEKRKLQQSTSPNKSIDDNEQQYNNDDVQQPASQQPIKIQCLQSVISNINILSSYQQQHKHITIAQNQYAHQYKLNLLRTLKGIDTTNNSNNTLFITNLNYNDYKSHVYLPYDAKYIYQYVRYNNTVTGNNQHIQQHIQQKLESLITENNLALGHAINNDFTINQQLLDDCNKYKDDISIKQEQVDNNNNTTQYTPFKLSLSTYQNLQHYMHSLLESNNPKMKRSFIYHTTALTDHIVNVALHNKAQDEAAERAQEEVLRQQQIKIEQEKQRLLLQQQQQQQAMLLQQQQQQQAAMQQQKSTADASTNNMHDNIQSSNTQQGSKRPDNSSITQQDNTDNNTVTTDKLNTTNDNNNITTSTATTNNDKIDQQLSNNDHNQFVDSQLQKQASQSQSQADHQSLPSTSSTSVEQPNASQLPANTDADRHTPTSNATASPVNGHKPSQRGIAVNSINTTTDQTRPIQSTPIQAQQQHQCDNVNDTNMKPAQTDNNTDTVQNTASDNDASKLPDSIMSEQG